MRLYCIYKITNRITGDTYIGQHHYSAESDPLGNYYGSGNNIKSAIKEYGKENFDREVLYSRILNRKTADAMEIWSIQRYKPSYNIASGGTGGNLGEEVRRRQSLAAEKKYQEYRRLGLPMKPERFENHPTKALHKYWDKWVAYWTQGLSYSSRANSGNRYTRISERLKGRILTAEDKAKKSATARKASIEYRKYKLQGGTLRWNEWRKSYNSRCETIGTN